MSDATLAGAWETYRAILPPNASRGQIIETKRAFYAGAAACLALMASVGDCDTVEAGMAAVDALLVETQAFAQSVAAGEA